MNKKTLNVSILLLFDVKLTLKSFKVMTKNNSKVAMLFQQLIIIDIEHNNILHIQLFTQVQKLD
jgi:hypothetical protein